MSASKPAAGFMKMVGGAWQVYCALEQIEGFRRAREGEARMLRSLEEAAEVRAFIMREEASEKLGAGRLGNLDDAAKFNMFDPNGIFLGALHGRAVFWNSTSHLLFYGATQTGKGRDLVLPNLAHVGNRSIVCTDIKNGENGYASAHHRRVNLKHRTIALNPHRLLDAPTFRFNPFMRLVRMAQAGQSIATLSLQASFSITPPKDGDDAWVRQGAQELLALLIEHRARFMADRCTPSELWRFSFGDTAAMLKTISRCGVDALEMIADSALRCMQDAPEQWSAYSSEMRAGTKSFRPGEPLAHITDASDFDPASMREEPTTVYLMSAESELEASAKWISLSIGAILETCANTQGPVPVTFLIDELANLPYMAVIPKALTLYAGLGIQLAGFCQGRNSLTARGYSEGTIKVFEEQAGVFGMWGVDDTNLMRDIEAWSGRRAVAIKGVNNSGGQVASASFSISEHARPVLQSEDIRAICDGQMILRVRGNHLFVVDRVPYFANPRWRDVLRDVRQLHHGGRERSTTPPPLPASVRQVAPPPLPRLITHRPQ
ncbi:type IV secretory system conjugative DNA transfer family protein [Aureimonas psammosilenae]|uniref:type IV secretory system conjugative DNA transfer family protein n=1 Tax=Aureimonas psammosilenae TaxID=2495496 RepID=UPI00186A2CBB|nr:type IV secretory system conjugative DNA transfer family protein [Aureimonas psammosilenae]